MVLHIQNLMAKVLQQEQITNYTLDIIPSSTKGDGYMSVIYHIKAKGEDKAKQQWKKNFVAKVAANDEATRKMMSTRVFFEIETHFYCKVFPVLLEFQKKKHFIKFEHVAKCFLANLEEGKETLIFEDLKANGYSLWNRKLPMPESHILEVLRLYGYYHAISFALKDQEPKIFEDTLNGHVDPGYVWIDKDQPKNMFLEVLNSYIPYMNENSSEEILNKFKNLIDNWDSLMRASKTEENPQIVITHGDAWCNNIMFKENQNEALEVRFLDFQCCRLASPVVDITYFFFASATEEILEKFDYYMEIYYESFSCFLNELGSDPNQLFTYEDFKEHLKRYGKIGLLISLLVIKFLYVEGDEVPELKEEHTERYVAEIKEKLKAQERVKANLALANKKGIG